MDYYERRGECTKCGECCRYIKFSATTTSMSSRDKEFLNARGIKVLKSKFTGEYFILVPSVCPHLKGNLCDLHKNGKPENCRVHPLFPWAHEGINCSYKWRKVRK